MSKRIRLDSSDRALVVMLHGLKSSRRAWDPLIALWQLQLPDAEFCALDAPYACPEGGFSWFENGGFECGSHRDIVASHAVFDAMFASVVTTRGFENRLNQVSLVGFSQGANLALDVLARGRWPVASAICFAGRLMAMNPFRPPRETALLLVHGDNDPIVPEQEGRRAAAAFERNGMRVERHVVEAKGHGISRNGAEIGGMFLRETLTQDRLLAAYV